MFCTWHLCNNTIAGKRRKFCSNKCKSKFYVTKYRKQTKVKAIAYKGGKCQICGYSKCSDALEFHHIEPEHKDFGIGHLGHTRSWDRVKEELDKCAMLCCRCHREVHAGLIDLSP